MVLRLDYINYLGRGKNGELLNVMPSATTKKRNEQKIATGESRRSSAVRGKFKWNFIERKG